MNFEIKFHCKDLVGDLRDGAYQAPDGVTVAGALDISAAEAGRTLTESVKNSLVFLVNGLHANWETVLHEGDKLRVLYKMLGG